MALFNSSAIYSCLHFLCFIIPLVSLHSIAPCLLCSQLDILGIPILGHSVNTSSPCSSNDTLELSTMAKMLALLSYAHNSQQQVSINSFAQQHNVQYTNKTYKMIRSLLAILAILATASAFAPQPNHILSRSTTSTTPTTTQIYQLGGEQERKKLTRDSEPDEFFSTNTDKMTDEEKIPIAIMGLVGISAPFIAGLIALYAAK